MIKFLEKFKVKPMEIHVSNKINPHKHWVILLRIFFIVVCFLIVFSLYLLYQIKNEQVFQVKPIQENQPSLLKENLLKSVTESFNQKAKNESELKKNPTSYTDPSQ